MTPAPRKKKNSPLSESTVSAQFARIAAVENAGDEKLVGILVEKESESPNLSTYLFEAFLPGYVGWRWAVIVAQLDGDSAPTLCDVVLLPGAGALLAPDWIPYSERITADDVGDRKSTRLNSSHT